MPAVAASHDNWHLRFLPPVACLLPRTPLHNARAQLPTRFDKRLHECHKDIEPKATPTLRSILKKIGKTILLPPNGPIACLVSSGWRPRRHRTSTERLLARRSSKSPTLGNRIRSHSS